MKLKRAIVLIAALTIAFTPLAGSGTAVAGGTSAVVVNQRDDSAVYRLMLQIRRVTGDTVGTSNVAAAVASCDSCMTVAVAIQGVLVMSDPSTFSPENLALAMNLDCTACQTLAAAYQTLVQTGGPAHFTAEGNQRIAEIRHELESIRNWDLSLEQIAARTEELNAELQQVMWTELVPAGDTLSSPPEQSPAGDTTTTPAETTVTPSDAQPTTTTTTTPADTTTTDTTTTDTGTTTTTSQP